MFINGVGDFRFFTGDERIFTAHDALQFRELTDHQRFQIGLGQKRRAVDIFLRGRFDLGCNLYRQFAETRNFFMRGSEQRMEDDFFERFHTIFQRNFLVFFKKERSVGQSRPQNPFIAFGHHGNIAGFRVADRNEIGQQFSRFIDDRKIFLMGNHRGGQNVFGNFQIVLFVTAAHDDRILHDKADRFQQIIRVKKFSADFRR